MKEIVVSGWPKEKNSDKNPYNKILYDAMGDDILVKEFNKKEFKRDCGDILHIHWPDHILRLSNSFKIRLRLWKLSKLVKKLHASSGKLIWTVHNLQPHKSSHPSLVKEGLAKIVDMTDGFIFLSEASRKEFFHLHPYAVDTPSVVIPHVHYRDYYKELDRSFALRKLMITPKPIQLLCFGVIRPHKGYERLFDVARHIESYQRVGWVIAGNPGKKCISQKLEALWSQNQLVYKACRHIEDVEIEKLFAASDVVVLPYEKILNSGTAILALSLGRKVIAPAIGSLAELQASVGTHWVYLYDPPIDRAKLDAAITWAETPLPLNAKPDLRSMSPRSVAKSTSDFYRELLKRDNI